VASRVRGDGVEGKARSWSDASWNLGRLREPVEGVAGGGGKQLPWSPRGAGGQCCG